MKRKPWGGLLLALALAVCLSLLPTTAQATGHTHLECGSTECTGHGDGEHTKNITWTAIKSENDLYETEKDGKGGYYYLTTDIVLSRIWEPADGVTLCLNGHSLTANHDSIETFDQTVFVDQNRSFTLTDCNGDNGSYTFRKNESGDKWELVTGNPTGSDDIKVTGGVITHAVGETGSGVHVKGTFTMYGGTIAGNRAENGGGVYAVSGGAFVMYGGTIAGNTTAENGGGINIQNSSKSSISGGSITKNSAANGYGGGVYAGNTRNFTISGSAVISGNSAANGGGVCVDGQSAVVTMTGGTIGGTESDDANTAAYGGGVYVNNGGMLTMNGSASVSGNSASSNGGGVYVNNGGMLTMSGSAKVSGNKSTGDGGGVYADGGSTLDMGGESVVSGNVSGNYASVFDIYGGGVYVDGGTFTMSGSAAIRGNQAYRNSYGGGVYAYNSTITMTGGTIGGTESGDANKATHGGGVYQDGGTFIMSGGKITGNKTKGTGNGGGVYQTGGTFTMNGSAAVRGNTANIKGGGVYTDGGGTLNMSDSAVIAGNIVEHTSAGSGGGVYAYNSTIDMTGGTIGGEESDANEAPYGGGVYLDGRSEDGYSTFTMSGGAVCGNKSTGKGGGVYVYDGCTFTMSDSAEVRGNKISGSESSNTSNGHGGGVYVVNGTFTMDGGAVRGNSAEKNGGGVYVNASSSGSAAFTMNDGASVCGNSTPQDGGGVYVYKVGNGNVTFTMKGGAEVRGNSAVNGGGVYMYNGTLDLRGTVTGNNASGEGAGVYVRHPQSGGDTPAVNLSGGAAVNSNWKNGALENGVYVQGENGTANNIYLPERKTLAVTGSLTGEGTIGVTSGEALAPGAYTTLANVAEGAEVSVTKFTPDTDGYSVARVENELWLVNGQLHLHAVCGGTTCPDTANHNSAHGDYVRFDVLSYDADNKKLNGYSASGEGYTLGAGAYYLNGNIELDAPLLIDRGVTLCLNGYSLTVKADKEAIIIAAYNGSLTLCDCKGGNVNAEYGRITHAVKDVGKYSGGGVMVYTGASFTMYGGSICGNQTVGAAGGAGVYVDPNASFTMYGGSVTENTVPSDNEGAGIYTAGSTTIGGSAEVSRNSAPGGRGAGIYCARGTLRIEGRAQITDNTAAKGGVYLEMAEAVMTVRGSAQITGNTAAQGGGVYVEKGTLKVSGSVKLTGNVDGSEAQKASNVYLGSGYRIAVESELADGENGARIGVTLPASVLGRITNEGQTVIVAQATEGNWIKETSFAYDDDTGTYTMGLSEDGTSVKLRHDHAWVYTRLEESTPTIEAKCSTCELDGGAVWLFVGSYTYTYETAQGPKAEHYSNRPWKAGPVTVVYKKGEAVLSGAPINAGDYTASITLTGADGAEAIIERTFRISKRTELNKTDFTFEPPQNAVYDGRTDWTVTIRANDDIVGVGEITPKYWKDGALPKNGTKDAGTYTVNIYVTEGDNYSAMYCPTEQEGYWTFTVMPASYTYRITSPQDIVVGSCLRDIVVPEGGTGVRLSNGSVEIVTGTLTWYSDATYSTSLADDIVLSGQVGSTTTLYWKFTPNDPNYIPDAKTGSVVLTFKEAQNQELRFNTSPVSKTYGDAPFTVEAVNASLGGGEVTYTSSDASIATVDSNGKVTIKKAGTVTITATAAAVSGKYKVTSASYTLTVAQAPIKIVGIIGVEGKDYDGGTDATARLLSYIPDMYKAKAGDDVYVISADVAFTDANAGWDKTARIDLNSIHLGGADAGNYTVDLVNSQTEVIGSIRKRELTLTHIDRVDKPYDGSTDYAVVTGERFDGLQNRETLVRDVDYTISAEYWPNADAGLKTVWVTVTLLDTAKARNYEAGRIGGQFGFADYARINQRVYGDQTDRLDVRYGRSGTKELGGLLAEARSTATVYAIEGDTSILSAYSLSADTQLYAAVVDDAAKIGASATIRILVTGVNYEDYFIDVAVTVSGKESVTISGLTYPYKTYDGQPIAPTGTLTVSGDKVPAGALEVWYTGTGSTVYSSASAPTAAGSYQALWRVADSNEDYTGSVTYSFSIGRRTVTVKPKNAATTEGAALPAFELEYAGLVSGDVLGVTPAPQFTVYEIGSDTEVLAPTAGSYRIYWTNADAAAFAGAESYDVFKVAVGVLTVSSAPAPTPGGSSGPAAPTYPVSTPDKPENGTVTVEPKNAGKGDTVTIVVKPDGGYEPGTVAVVDKDGSKLPLTDEGGGRYSFVMPEGGVTVKADFVKKGFFVDVPADSFYYEAVKWAVEKGITNGTDAMHFSPNEPCTRAQIVTFLWRAAGSPEPKSLSSFADVPANAYYAKAVAWAAEQGIALGVDATHFDPNATCTRAHGVTFLARAVKAAGDGRTAFTDVLENAYYAPAVKWAADNGVTEGIGGGLFGPNNDCTRAQIVTFLYRLYAKA